MANKNDDYLDIISDYLFTLLPFVVMSLVFLLWEHDLGRILYISEWSFASAVINGQLIVRLVKKNLQISQITKERRPSMGGIGLLFTLLIVILFVPSLILLALVIVNKSQSILLVSSQIVIFVASSVTYFFVNRLFIEIQEDIKENESKKKISKSAKRS